jgi:hypothetical protein
MRTAYSMLFSARCTFQPQQQGAVTPVGSDTTHVVYAGTLYPVLKGADRGACIILQDGACMDISGGVPAAAARALSLPLVGSAEERLGQLLALGAVAQVLCFVLRDDTIGSGAEKGRAFGNAGRKHLILSNGLVTPVFSNFCRSPPYETQSAFVPTFDAMTTGPLSMQEDFCEKSGRHS